MSTPTAPCDLTPAARRAWLCAAGRQAAPQLRYAVLLTMADVVPAVGFAAGLALAIASLSQGLRQAAPWLLLAAVAGVGRSLLARAAQLSAMKSANAVKLSIRDGIVRGLLRRRRGDPATLGETMSVAVEGVEALEGYYGRFLPARAAAGVVPLAVIAAMAFASPIAAAIAAATLVPFIVAMALAGGAAAGESRRQFTALARLSGLFSDRLRALPAILAFQAEEEVTTDLARSAQDLSARTLKVLRVAFLSSSTLEFFAALAVALVAVYCGFNLLRLLPFHVPETLDLARAFFVLALAPEVYAPLRRLAAVYHDRQAAETVVDSLIGMSAASAAPRRPTAGGSPPALSLRNVTVAFDRSDRPAISGFSLEVRPGEIVALMGPTGCGKTTVLDLLLGRAQATAGMLQVDGLALDPASPPAAAWAGQSPVVIPGTLADNIALAQRDAHPRRLIEVARDTGLEDAPGGLHRRIDERGGGLSGGERRRLALARAMLKDARLLLLDEPTANLDQASEAELLPVIRRAAQGRTTLIATHSEAVARIADRVVRLAA